MKNSVTVLGVSVPNAGLIKDSPMEMVLRNKLTAEERDRNLRLQGLYLRNLIIFTFKKVIDSSYAEYRSIEDRQILMKHCGSDQLLFDLLRQMERLLEESAQKLDQKRLLLKSLKPVLWFIPVFGWVILHTNREVFANLNEYGSLAALDNKRELERRNISTEKLVRDFANNTLAKGISSHRHPVECDL